MFLSSSPWSRNNQGTRPEKNTGRATEGGREQARRQAGDAAGPRVTRSLGDTGLARSRAVGLSTYYVPDTLTFVTFIISLNSQFCEVGITVLIL